MRSREFSNRSPLLSSIELGLFKLNLLFDGTIEAEKYSFQKSEKKVFDIILLIF